MDILKSKTSLALIVIVAFVLIGAAFLLQGTPEAPGRESAISVGSIEITLREPPRAVAESRSISTGYVTLTLEE